MGSDVGLTRVVGVGASAGGLDALIAIVEGLTADVPAAICIVVHVPATSRSPLAEILDRRTELSVRVARDGEPVRPARIYVAPPDRHLTVAGGRLRLERGPRENGARPAVDPLLRSLAGTYEEHAVAVILSGALGDGSQGAAQVNQAGGTVIVQDPDDATVPSMPESALRAVGEVDAVLPASEIGPALVRLAEGARQVREELLMICPDESHEVEPVRPAGPPSALTCPECNGSLWELSDGELTRYRCRVGHAYSEDSMVVEQGSAVESALWSALELLEERAQLIRPALGIDGDQPTAFDVQCAGAAE